MSEFLGKRRVQKNGVKFTLATNREAQHSDRLCAWQGTLRSAQSIQAVEYQQLETESEFIERCARVFSKS